MSLKNPCDEIENWIKNPKRKHKQLSSPRASHIDRRRQREERRLQELRQRVQPWIGKKVNASELDENDLDKIGMSISSDGILEFNKRMKKSKSRVVD
jgi:hypothetical protein